MVWKGRSKRFRRERVWQHRVGAENPVKYTRCVRIRGVWKKTWRSIKMMQQQQGEKAETLGHQSSRWGFSQWAALRSRTCTLLTLPRYCAFHTLRFISKHRREHVQHCPWPSYQRHSYQNVNNTRDMALNPAATARSKKSKQAA